MEDPFLQNQSHMYRMYYMDGGIDCDESRPLRQVIGVGEKDTTLHHVC